MEQASSVKLFGKGNRVHLQRNPQRDFWLSVAGNFHITQSLELLWVLSSTEEICLACTPWKVNPMQDLKDKEPSQRIPISDYHPGSR